MLGWGRGYIRPERRVPRMLKCYQIREESTIDAVLWCQTSDERNIVTGQWLSAYWGENHWYVGTRPEKRALYAGLWYQTCDEMTDIRLYKTKVE